MSNHIDIIRRIRSLNRMDRSKVAYSSIQTRVSLLSESLIIPATVSPSTEQYFRVRTNPKTKPQRLSDIGAPPVSAITDFQRCNPPERPTFYAATNRKIAFFEARLQKDDIFYLSQWMPTEPIPFNEVFTEEQYEKVAPHSSPSAATIYSYFETLFTQKIHPNFSSDYKITAAIFELLTSNFTPNEKMLIRGDGRIGLRYPSVWKLDDGVNIALEGNFARERLTPLHLMEARVISDTKGLFEIEVIDNAYRFDDEAIIWSGNPHAIPHMRADKSVVYFQRVKSSWVIPVRNDPHSPEDIQKLLAE